MSIEQYRKDFSSALRSYNAMETTKRRHFELMTLLDSKKKKFNLEATLDEMERLEALLRDHNDEVQAFKARCEALKLVSPEAHQALFEYIAELNKAEPPVSNIVSH